MNWDEQTSQPPLTHMTLHVQDYVKWRGPLFHRFLVALVDTCPTVGSLAEYLLSDTLATKVYSYSLLLCFYSLCAVCTLLNAGSGYCRC